MGKQLAFLYWPCILWCCYICLLLPGFLFFSFFQSLWDFLHRQSCWLQMKTVLFFIPNHLPFISGFSVCFVLGLSVLARTWIIVLKQGILALFLHFREKCQVPTVSIERVTGRKARGLQMEEIACKYQTFFFLISLLSSRRKQTSDIFFPLLYTNLNITSLFPPDA